MTIKLRHVLLATLLAGLSTILGGANGDGCEHNTSDDVQRRQQEQILQEGTSQIGMPAITHFRERRLLKDILELRDQEGLVTYTYIWNAFTGKLVFFCDSIGYGIPYATQFTNPQKQVSPGYHDSAIIAQADPNGLFSPASAEGTWVMCKDPTPGSKDLRPQYIEPRAIVTTYKVPPGLAVYN
jgi:hypothetical protein